MNLFDKLSDDQLAYLNALVHSDATDQYDGGMVDDLVREIEAAFAERIARERKEQ